METFKTFDNGLSGSIIFIPDRTGMYKLIIIDPVTLNWLDFKDLEFQPGWEIHLLNNGVIIDGVKYSRAQLQVIREDGSMIEDISGNILISENELNNSGKLYTADEVNQMLRERLTLVLNQIMDEGYETYKNITVFSKYFVEKLGQIINLNQTFPDMYRELWYAKDKIWESFSKDLCVKVWQCLSDYRFAQTVIFNGFLEPSQIEFIQLSPEDEKQWNLFNMPYIPVLAEASEAPTSGVAGVEKFTFSDSRIEYLKKQLYVYKSYSQRALIKSREILKAVNIETDQNVVIVENPETPVVPEIFNPEDQTNNSVDPTQPGQPETTNTTETKKINLLPWIIGAVSIFKLLV